MSKLCTLKYIENSWLSSELVLEFSSEPEPILLTGLSDITTLIFPGHLVEDDASGLCEEWSRPEEDIRDIGGRARDDDIIFALVIWMFREVLSPILDRMDTGEPETFDEVIHRLDLLSYTIEECHLEIRQGDLEWNPWESSSRTDIKELDWFLVFGLRFLVLRVYRP